MFVILKGAVEKLMLNHMLLKFTFKLFMKAEEIFHVSFVEKPLLLNNILKSTLGIILASKAVGLSNPPSSQIYNNSACRATQAVN